MKRVTSSQKLLDQQRKLYGLAEEIEICGKEGKPLRSEVATWLSVTLRRIACGEDAEVTLGVKPDKQGVRRDRFLQELQRKIALAYAAAATDKEPDYALREPLTNEAAFRSASTISRLGPKTSTIRKNWSGKDADRRPKFTLGKP